MSSRNSLNVLPKSFAPGGSLFIPASDLELIMGFPIHNLPITAQIYQKMFMHRAYYKLLGSMVIHLFNNVVSAAEVT
jgi:hypothetical protein